MEPLQQKLWEITDKLVLEMECNKYNVMVGECTYSFEGFDKLFEIVVRREALYSGQSLSPVTLLYSYMNKLIRLTCVGKII